MSLKVWIPFTDGTAKNLGISNLTFTNYNSSVTYSNNSGKLGKCMLNTGFSGGGFISNTTINLGTNISMFCWVNPTAFTASANLNGIITNHHYETSSGMGLVLRYASSTTGYIGITEGRGSNGRTYDTHYGNTLLTAGNWYHIGFTYNGNTVTFYLNGNPDGTKSISGLNAVANYIGIFRWSDTYTSDYEYKGLLNDVRIYDHCLTPQEVKEISKGLVCHYTLGSESVYEATTNKFTYPTPGSSVGAVGWNQSLHPNAIYVSGWDYGYNGGVTDPGTVYHAMWNVIDGIPTMVFLDLNSTKGHTHSWEGISGGGLAASDFTSGKKYTVSFTAKSSVNGGAISCGLYYRRTSSEGYNFYDGCPQTTLTTTWKRYSVTYTSQGANSISSFYFYGMYGNEGIKYVRDVLLEFLDHATPYTPSSRSPGIVYDSSGYSRNLTITGNVSPADSVRYDKGLYLANLNINSNYLIANGWSPSGFLTTGSISFWCKFNGLGSSGWLPFIGLSGSYYIMATSGGSGNFYHEQVGSATKTIYRDGVVVSAPSDNGNWHHYCITGVDISNWTNFKVNLYGSSLDSNMYISDLRLYNTVLSADDVKDLYNLGALIS